LGRYPSAIETWPRLDCQVEGRGRFLSGGGAVMTFEVLSAEGEDATRWTELIEALPAECRDIHFLPEYGRIYRDTYGFGSHLAVYPDDRGYVVQPFVRRPLRELPFLAGFPDAKTYSDIANPYGFGGPVSNVTDVSLAQELYKTMAEGLSRW